MSSDSNWADGPLHKFLVGILPFYVKEPFSSAPRLDIQKLRKALGKSHEAVYKWLRTSRLNPRNVDLILTVANDDANLNVLRQLERTAPTKQDFHVFIFEAA